MLMGQNSYIRQTITTGNLIHFWHGATKLFPTILGVPTYYVSNAGNDSNDGLSDATAWPIIRG